MMCCVYLWHWSEEYTYSPIPIRLKQRLTTLDLRHFVWNIGERLGTKNGYNGYARADFIKAMFPDVMKDIEQDSIRNFKFQPNKGSIVIDEPDEDDYHFYILPAINSFSRMSQLENRSSNITEAWMESAYIPLDRPKVVMSVGTMP